MAGIEDGHISTKNYLRDTFQRTSLIVFILHHKKIFIPIS